MEGKKTLMFGMKYQVGNFFVIKYNKVLTKYETDELRRQIGIPADQRRNLQRAKLPYIKVEAISGVWAVEFCCNTLMFRFIDETLAAAVKAHAEGEKPESNSVADFALMFSMMFTDTTVLGDGEYTQEKGKALKALMERQSARAAARETPEEKAADDKVLEEVKADEEAKATIIDMANRIKEGGSDGQGS